MLDRKTLDRWLEKYNALEKRSDMYWEKSEKYEAEGDKEKMDNAIRRMEEMDDRMDGMLEALNIFGYTIVVQRGENKVVEK